MQIRQRLTYHFVLVFALILFLSSTAIYFLSAHYRQEDFYSRLLNKANNTAKILIEVEEVNASLLRRIERDNPSSLPKERIIIYDHTGEIQYTSDEDRTLKVTPQLLARIQSDEEVRFVQNPFEAVGFLYTDRSARIVVVAAAEDIHGKKKLRNLRTVLVAVFGVSIVLVFLSGWLYAGRALRPISRVIDQVDDISITSLNLRVAEGKENDEISKLARTFNSMLDRLESAFKIQKDFISNASHELRTPLTTITGQLDVALMSDRSVEDYKRILHSVLEDIKNLNLVSNRLLLLAQTSSRTSGTDFRPLRIDDIIWLSAAELRKRNPDYRISVELDEALVDDEQLTIAGNELLLKTLVTNVLDNGCKYSADHSVVVNIKPRTNTVMLIVRDHGIGIEADDLQHVFEPFYRGKNAVSVRGHGIGLSLVDRIVKLHEGTIRMISKPGEGTTLIITFPFLKNLTAL
jgi:signal transduction histidine kinase